MTESSSSSKPVRIVELSTFDRTELSSKPFPSEEAAAEFLAQNPDSDDIIYDIERQETDR